MKLPVLESKQLDEGRHEGVIIGVEYRDEPFKYTDIIIESEGVRLKAGYPTLVSENSKLGKLLLRFGDILIAGNETDPDNLIGRKCQFLVTTVEKGEREYSNVLPETVRPLKEEGDR